jgi:hypothetical protein
MSQHHLYYMALTYGNLEVTYSFQLKPFKGGIEVYVVFFDHIKWGLIQY